MTKIKQTPSLLQQSQQHTAAAEEIATCIGCNSHFCWCYCPYWLHMMLMWWSPLLHPCVMMPEETTLDVGARLLSRQNLLLQHYNHSIESLKQCHYRDHHHSPWVQYWHNNTDCKKQNRLMLLLVLFFLPSGVAKIANHILVTAITITTIMPQRSNTNMYHY